MKLAKQINLDFQSFTFTGEKGIRVAFSTGL